MRITRRFDPRALIVIAAGLLPLAACESGGESPPTDGAPAVTAPEANAEQIATSFVDAYGAFDAEEAITYLADDAAIVELIGSVGAHTGVLGTRDELPLLLSYLEAAGYGQTHDSCEAQSTSSSGTLVHCTFDFHLFGSDRLGLGPYSGSSFDLTVLDGAIVRAHKSFGTEEFSGEMWEPFAAWVSEAYPEDVTEMYEDETQQGIRLSDESVRLWRRHVREYVQEMQA
jgi:hypothetical protein